jgi:hypothetical protein
MITYFTKQYQAVPALMQLYRRVGGTFVSTRSGTIQAIKKVYPEASAIRLTEKLGRFSAGYRVLRESNIIVTGSPNKALLSQFDARKYMIFHGTYAFMAQEEIAGLGHFDHIGVIGPRMLDALADSGLESKIIMSGYLPFLEFPERNVVQRAQFLQKLGLNPELPTLLYLPRGRPYGSWDVMAEKLLREIPDQYNLILRPHPSQSVAAHVWDKFGFMKLQQIAIKRGNAFIDLTSCNLATLFSVCDLLISDGASSPEESLYYDLPQVFVESEGSSPTAIAQMMREKRLTENYIEKLLTIYECGTRITPATPDISRVFANALVEADQYKPYRQRYFKWVFGDLNVGYEANMVRSLESNSQKRLTEV